MCGCMIDVECCGLFGALIEIQLGMIDDISGKLLRSSVLPFNIYLSFSYGERKASRVSTSAISLIFRIFPLRSVPFFGVVCFPWNLYSPSPCPARLPCPITPCPKKEKGGWSGPSTPPVDQRVVTAELDLVTYLEYLPLYYY